MPTPRSVSEIKTNLLRPALTSHFEVQIFIPENIKNIFKSTGRPITSLDETKLRLSCSEVSLPGSSLATLEINNDYTGVTERHAHRRIYDDRIDFTFYVDAEKYLPILIFETWIKYIAGEQIAIDENMRGMGSESLNYFYRVRYPEQYISPNGLKVIKFEKDYSGSSISYEFIGSYPISITSMPISYEASNLLKCTVSMTYIRYIVRDTKGSSFTPEESANSTPAQQDSLNGVNFGTALSLDNLINSYGFSGGTGGVPLTAVNASGNTVQVQNFNTNKMTRTVNGGSTPLS